MDFPRQRAFLLSCLVSAGLAAITPHPVRAQSPSPEAALDAARSAFEVQPEADRKAIQDALIWTGDYSGVADGTFGRQTQAAIAGYQVRAQQPSNGILTPQARATLLRAAQQARNGAGFTLIDDSRTGIRIGIPTKILPKQNANPAGGSRWQSADDRVTLDTRSMPPDATLQSLYDRNVATQTPGRVVSYKVLRPDFFVIAGETTGGKFYTRYSSGPGGLRGFSIGYDKALAPQLDRLVVAIANSFTPFPAPTAPAAVAQAPEPQIKPQTRNVIGTGIAVGSRQVVTTAPVRSCREVQVSGLKPRQITGQGPFILDFSDDVKAQSIKAAHAPLIEGASLLVVGFLDDSGKASLFALPAQALSTSTLSASLQPGMSGAPVLEQGAVVGLVGPVSSERRRIAGIIPAASYPVVPVPEIVRNLLNQQHEPEAQNRAAADIVSAVRPALLPIICGP